MKRLRKYTRNYDEKYQCFKELKAVQDKRITKNNNIIARAEKSTERAKNKINNIPYPYWTKEILEYMAKDMLQYFPDGSTCEIMGPFGLGSRASIWIKCKNYELLEDDKYKEPNLYSFEVEPFLEDNNARLYHVNTNVNTGKYRIGTIGELNGMNNPVTLISNNITIKEFILMYYPTFEFKEK